MITFGDDDLPIPERGNKLTLRDGGSDMVLVRDSAKSIEARNPWRVSQRCKVNGRDGTCIVVTADWVVVLFDEGTPSHTRFAP